MKDIEYAVDILKDELHELHHLQYVDIFHLEDIYQERLSQLEKAIKILEDYEENKI